MKKPLRFVILEDRQSDAELLVYELRRAGFIFEWTRVETETDYCAELAKYPDLILADYTLPQFDALHALALLQQYQLHIPFIIVSGTIGEEQAVAAMRHGATDYLLKDRLARLGSAVNNALNTYQLRQEHQRDTAKLQEREALYRLISENTGDVFWLLDLYSLKFLYISPSIIQIRGYSAEEAMNQTLYETLTAESLNRIVPQLPSRIAALEAGDESVRSQIHEVDHIHQNGHTVPTEILTTLIQNETGRVTRMLGVTRDLRERRRAEQVLREKDELLREVSRIASVGGWEFDPQTMQGTWTDEVAHIHGIGTNTTHDILLGLHFFDTEDHDHIQQAISGAVTKGIPYNLELQLHSADGHSKWVRIIGYPIFDTNKTIVKVRGTLQDITERKRAELILQDERASLAKRIAERTAELSKANQELAQAVRAKDEFLAMMSHELRTPLNAILGLTESLQEAIYGSLNPRQIKAISTIEQSGRHLLALISDILDLSKIEAGKLEFRPEVVGVADICQASLTFIREAAVKKQLNVHFMGATPNLQLIADPRRLKQILVNLLSNAVKFTPNRGNVTLEVQPDAEQQQIQFIVQDTGIGISADHLQHLFQPFTQIDSSLSRQYEGTGLGLALVQRLVDMHGGSVTVTSSGVVGEGSCFAICLPWSVADAPLSYQTEPIVTNLPSTELIPPRQQEPYATILYVEDNEISIQTISDYLLFQGYEVIVAHNGYEAIDLLERILPDLILMDIQMPQMDGLQATHLIRSDMRFAQVPIIALTALAMPGDRERCLAAGASEYLTKPVNLKKLSQLIEQFV